jgi:hypothetical protein
VRIPFIHPTQTRTLSLTSAYRVSFVVRDRAARLAPPRVPSSVPLPLPAPAFVLPTGSANRQNEAHNYASHTSVLNLSEGCQQPDRVRLEKEHSGSIHTREPMGARAAVEQR